MFYAFDLSIPCIYFISSVNPFMLEAPIQVLTILVKSFCPKGIFENIWRRNVHQKSHQKLSFNQMASA